MKHRKLQALTLVILATVIIILAFIHQNKGALHNNTTQTQLLNYIPLSSTIPPGSCIIYGLFMYNKGDTIKILTKWKPKTTQIIIMLCDATTGDCIYRTCMKEHELITFKAWTSSEYYIMICNYSNMTIYQTTYLLLS